MNKYLQLLRMSFEEFLEYRLNFVFNIGGFGLSVLILILFWTTILENSSAFKALDRENLISYYLFMGIISSVTYFPVWKFSRSILEGDIVNIITRPLSNVIYWFIKLLPWKASALTVYSIIGATLYFFNINIFPQTGTVLRFIYTLFFGILGNFLINYTIGLLAIWLKRVYGITHLVKALEGLLAGTFIPIFILPEFIQKITKFLPFRYFIYFPIEIIQRDLDSVEFLKNFAIQISWLLFFIILTHIIWKKGLKKLDVIGI